MSAQTQDQENRAFFADADETIAYSRLWFYVLRVHRRYLPLFTRALKQEGFADPLWYEILFELVQSGHKGQTMTALQSRLAVPQYALSRHVARMEREGLLLRTNTEQDRRQQILFPSNLGKAKQGQVWEVYFTAIKAELSQHLDTTEAYQLARDLLRLLR